MKIEKRTQVKSWKQKIVLLAGVLCLALMASAPAQAEPDVPFVMDAITKAKEAPTAEGRWVVTATVKFTSENSPTMTATGPISFEGLPLNGLKGIIPMTIGDDAATSKTNDLGLAIKADGTVGIQWRIAGKPFLGRRPLVFSPTAFPDHFSKVINFGGAKRRMRLYLASEWVKLPRIRKKPPVQTEAKTPIGKRYKITGRLVVTDSSDGYGDNTVEIKGVLLLTQRAASSKGGQMQDRSLCTIIPQPLNKNASLPFDNNILVDHIFANPKTEYIQVRAIIYDEDDVSANDCMNYNESRPQSLVYVANATAKKGERTLPGDRDSENVEVYYNVTFVKDLYEGDVK